jgi:rhodanese-related sulfurtransferase
MNFKRGAAICMLLSICVMLAGVRAGEVAASTFDPLKTPEIELITAEELKAKLARNEPVTIIDVRSTDTYIDSENKIKGAIHVKLRRLKARLALRPLKDIPRDQEIITYCACPKEETSIRAAQVLLEAGFKRVRALKGGWQAWLQVGGQLEPRPKV